MRYEDASQAGSFDTQSMPVARSDTDALATGSMGPASGNVVTGAGTTSGAAGADAQGDAPARIISLQGASGGSSSENGDLQAAGQFGMLSMDGQGGYNYVRNAGSPDGGVDVFTYTLADRNGDQASARLTITLGKEEQVADVTDAAAAVNAGVVTLPAGVELSDIRVVGRDLVVTLPDGSLMTIPGGAVFVPQLVIGDVEVPPANLAALLIDSEPQPASGTPQSSGGNFEVDVAPLDPGVPLGDLLPPTELNYVPPEFDDVGQFEDKEPDISIIPDDGVQTDVALDSVEESGLPARPGNEPAGSNAGGNGETTVGTIVYVAPDSVASIAITVNGVTTTLTGPNQVIAGLYGDLTITSIADGAIGYSYTLRDNTSGDTTRDDFLVTLTDSDGDTDTATLRIDIVDDVPTARADTDSIAAGEFGPATGNVITDAAGGDAGDSDSNAADTLGADNATLTSVSGFGGSSDSAFDGNGNLQVNGQYGVLLIKANGDYSYTRNANTPGGVTDTFTYTLTDGDGDTSSSTLAISIGDRSVTVGANADVLSDDDAVPGSNGNAAGTGDDADAQNLSGTLSGSGGDGALTFDLLTSGAPAGFSYADGPNGSLLVQQVQGASTVTVLTVTINAATGAYTVTQNAPIRHTAAGDENNQSFTINYSVNDADGDSGSGTLTINVDDDTPTVNVSKTVDHEVVLTTQDADTIGAASDTSVSSANFGGLFAVTSSLGADGGAAPALTYALAVTNSASGLTSNGAAVNLYNVGGTIVGSTAGSAPASLTDASVVFTVAVSASGVVTLTQLQQIDHAVEGTTTSPFDDQFALLGDGKISLTASSTVTDADGDPATDGETIDLGGNIRFADDGPDVNAAIVAGTTIRVDETDGVAAAGGEVDAPGGNLGTVTVARAAYLSVNDVHASADAPTSYSYVLQLGTAVGGLVNSGLQLSSSNAPIYLYNVGGTIVGSTALSAPASVNDASVAFTISLNASGDVTLTQILAVEHGTPGSSHDEDSSGLAAGALNVRITATDFDGDTDSVSVDLGGIIRFEDDGPSVNVTQANEGAILLTTQDAQTIGAASDSDVSTANFGSVFAVSSTGGSDGAASVSTSYELAVTSAASGLTSHGVAINLYNVGGTIVGSTSGSAPASLADASVVFTVAVNGSGAVTLTQLQQVDHAVEGSTGAPFYDQFAILANGKISLTASSTVTDNDGDVATDMETVDLGGNIRFADDGPDVSATLVSQAAIRIDETDAVSAAGGETDPVGGNLGSVTLIRSAYLNVTDPHASADAPTSYAYQLQLGTAVGGLVNSGLMLSTTNAPIYLYNVGGTVVGSIALSAPASIGDPSVAFTVAIAPSGDITLTQLLAVEHGNTASFDEDSSGLASGALKVVVTATDFDGDTDSASVDLGSIIRFEDDGPAIDVLQANEAGVLLTTQDAQTVGNASDVDTSSAHFGSVFSFTSSGGADGASNTPVLSYALSVTNSLSGLTSHGAAINLYQVNGTIVGSTSSSNPGILADPSIVFTISVGSTGVVTLTQMQQVDHAVEGVTTSPFDDQFAVLASGKIALTASATITDNDGDSVSDSATIDLGGNIRFADDGPSVSVSALPEAGVELHTQDADTIGMASDSAQSSANFGGVFSASPVSGADAPASVAVWSYALGLTAGTSGLTSHGVAINLYNVGGTIVGSTASTAPALGDASVVFTVSVDNSGLVTLTQFQHVDHAVEGTTGAPFADQAAFILNDNAITLTGTATVTDFDGDTATSSATIGIANNLKFDDDGPDVSAALVSQVTIRVDETDGVVAAGGETDVAGGNLGTVTVVRSAYLSVTDAHASADAPTNYGYALQLGTPVGGLVNSGLQLSTTNAPIYLYNVGGTIVGSTALSAPASVNDASVAFTIAINASGDVTLTQLRAVEHGNSASFDESSSGLAAGALSVVVTATDFDGDTDSASVDLGSIIRFEDDGPCIDVTAGADGGVLVTTQDADTVGTNSDMASSSAAFGGLFNIAVSSGGSDGAATSPTLSYALDVPGAGANGVDSGLNQSGANIYLYEIGGKVVGSTSATQAGVLQGNIVFDVAVSTSGVVTLTQYSQIDHPIAADPTPSGSPFADQLIWMADNLVTLTASASITDNDGDTATDSRTLNIGSNLRFADDGPVAVADTNMVTEGGSTGGNVLTDGSDDSFGADGMGSIQGVAAGSSIGSPIMGGVGVPIVTALGTLTLNANGTYTYVSKDNSVSSTQVDSFVYTIVDADGDTSTVTLNITINPVTLPADNQTKTVNEAAIDTTITGSDVAAGSVTGSQPGLTAETVTGQLTVAGAALNGYAAQNVTTAHGTFVLDTDGSYTYTLTAPFDGPTLNDGTAAHLAVEQFTYTVSDANGNSTTGTITINVIDDVPSVNVSKGADLSVVLGTQDAETIGGLSDSQQSSANFGGVFGLTYVAGADGAAVPTLSYALGVPGAGANGVDSGLDQSGNAIYLYVVGGKVVGSTSATAGGVVAANTVFDVAVNGSGQVTLTQYSQIDHPVEGTTTAPFDDQFVGILDTLVTLTATSTITDNDGDVASDSETVNIGQNLRFYDDGPTIDVIAGSDAGLLLTTQDTETDGTPTTQDSATTSFAGAFGLSVNPGADGAAAPSLSYSLGFQAGASGLTSGGVAINLYKIGNTIVGSTALDQASVTSANTVFEVSVVASGVNAGSVTLTQYAQIDHTVANPANNGLADGKITLTASSTITDSDGDTASDSATINIGSNLVFQDDAPDITAVTTGTQLRIDETDGVAAAGGESDSAGGNLGTVTIAAASLYTVTNVNVSADSPAAYSYALVVANGTDSGLDYSATNESILLYQVSPTLVEGRVGGSAGAVAFSVSINAATGATTLTQFLAVEHPTSGASHDEASAPLAANALQVEIKATDFDGDFDTALVDLGSIIRFEDDGPRINAATNINIQNAGDIAHTGTFDFSLGSDSPNQGSDDIKNVTMTINVNGTNVTATPVGTPTETATTATYTYSFSYAINASGGTATNTVVLIFDKANDTYTVDLAHPIQPFTTINSTAQATTFLGYDGGTTTPTNSQPDVVNVQLRADNLATTGTDESLWVRLTGLAGSPGTTSGDMTLTAGELITGGQSWVSASNTANGVAGDIVNQDEVLNLDLFTANQFGNATTSATTSASAIYFKLDNIGNSEDFVVNLKLWSDTNGNNAIDAGETTTRAIYVANSDMYKGAAGPGQYSGVTLDNNDALVIIESNDYNFGAENYRIIGAQIATSDQGISGAAIDLNGTINAASTVDDNVNMDSNNLGFKIQDIGFVSQTTAAQTATLTIGVTVGDADGDTATQTLTATVTSAADSSSSATMSVAATNTVGSEVQRLNTAANSNSVLVGTLAAAGLAEAPVAASLPQEDTTIADLNVATGRSSTALTSEADAEQAGQSSILTLDGDLGDGSETPEQDSGTAFRTMEVSREALAEPAEADETPADLPEGTDQPVTEVEPASIMADAIPSIEYLIAAAKGLDASKDGANGETQPGTDVGKVIADALAGGEGQGSNIDALLDAIAGPVTESANPDGAGSSQAPADVSMWHGSTLADFGGANGELSIHAMVNHPDAVQAAA